MDMGKLTLVTRVYILATMAFGVAHVFWFFKDLHTDNVSLATLFILFILASIAQIIRVKGTTNRSHYAVSFVVYAFCLFRLGLVETMFVILVSYFAQWLWRRPPWYISSFNSASLIIVSNAAFFIFNLLDPGGDPQGWRSVTGIILSMTTFMLLNHLMVGIIVWLARGENFIRSGIFDFLPLIIDLTLLVMGGSFFLIWNFNPYAILLFLPLIYLVYNTLRVPALERQTELDPKTGLYNNAYFMNQLENELSRAQRFERPLAVLMADLDLLRNINNTYGHLAGDEVLLAIAKILQTSVREYDIVARFGGEEFSVLMPETTVDVAFERAEKIRQAIEATEFTIATSVTPIKVTMSIGVAGRLRLNQTKEEIIHNADTVLYQAKLKGRNRTVIYNESMYEGLFPHQTSPVFPGQFDTQVQAPIPARSSVSDPHNTRPVTRVDRRPGEPPVDDTSAPVKTPAEQKLIRRRIYLFIFMLVASAVLLFMLFYQPFDLSNLGGLLLFVLVLIFTEANSTEIYIRDTAVSTSTAPLVAGALLFGPVGALVLSMIFSFTTYLKYKGPKDRLPFNMANQFIPAMLFLGFIILSGIPFQQRSPLIQLLITILCMSIVYIFTTAMLSIDISLNTGVRVRAVWLDQFSWLASYYLAMGVMAYALILGFTLAGFLGLGVILFPLMVLRLGQLHYIERTRAMVTELREKNFSLKHSSDEISRINDGLFETLANLIDLRDPQALGHSQQVTHHAVLMAEMLGFGAQRVQMIRRACLLHDLGKLGVPSAILTKTTALSEHDEYTVVKNHPAVGASLLSKSPSLKGFIPIVRHHHERYDGQGYPDGLQGNDIPVEARIVAVADAIDAMSSNLVDRQALNREEIIVELKRNTGMQFDPQIAAIAIELLESGKIKVNNKST
jgi:diguanylate cyclase (GGDEF)-like protein/putative nucleotidyltransferase with HDIG domain